VVLVGFVDHLYEEEQQDEWGKRVHRISESLDYHVGAAAEITAYDAEHDPGDDRDHGCPHAYEK
jgi:hypothetical protein